MPSSPKHEIARNIICSLLTEQRFTQPIMEKQEFQGVGYIDFAGMKSLSALFVEKDGKLGPIIFVAPCTDFQIKRDGSQMEVHSRLLSQEFFSDFMNAVHNFKVEEVEFVLHHLKPGLLTPVISGKGWDVWGFGNQGESGESCLQNRQAETRKKTKVMINELKKHKPSYQNILFLGCGDGIDVRTFLENEGRNLVRSRITAIDLSKFALDSAEFICRDAKSKVDASVNFKQVDFDNITSLCSEGPFDLVISVGIFDRETLSFEQGVDLASKLRMLIKPEGLLTSSAYAFELFEKKNYQDLGYVPLQCAVTEHLFTEKYIPLYIMKNSLSAIRQTEDFVASRSYRIWR